MVMSDLTNKERIERNNELLALNSELLTETNNIINIAKTSANNLLDTRDATAAVNDILSGKTAYVNGQKLTGTYTPTVDVGGHDYTEEEIVTTIEEHQQAEVLSDDILGNINSEDTESEEE